MKFWRKRPEGFEWNEYVRTTIQLRRDQRQAKLEDVKRQVAHGVRVAGSAAVDGAIAGAAGVGAGLHSLFRASWGHLLRVLVPVMQWLELSALWLIMQLARPSLALPLLAFGGTMLYSGLFGSPLEQVAADKVAPATVAAGLVMLLAGVPSLLTNFGYDVSEWGGDAERLRYLPASVLAIAVSVFGAVLLSSGAGGSGGAVSWLPRPGVLVGQSSTTQEATGLAVALSGDKLRIAGQVFKLAGIEALLPEQICHPARLRSGAPPSSGNQIYVAVRFSAAVRGRRHHQCRPAD